MIAFIFHPHKNGEKSRLWSARIRLEGWSKPRYFPLHVTDKRVADQKLRELVTDLEREAHGVGVPRAAREAQHTSLTDHHVGFMAACISAQLSTNTLNKYRHSLPKLFARCGWQTLRDVTAPTFIAWRERSGLLPKTVNDLLGSMRTMLLWMKRTRLITVDPLSDVRKVSNPRVGSFRRALSVQELQRLLTTSPRHRAVVYQTIIYTGLRRAEMNGLKWDDFKLDDTQPFVRVPSSISKNRKESVHYLRPELAATLRSFRPADAKPEDFVFRGQLPRIPTFKRDLAAVGIPFEDARGRRIDLHGLRKTYGTMLAAAGVSPRVAMELMRHSDMKLTMGVYTDVAQLPLIVETARLPSLSLPNTPIAHPKSQETPKLDAHGDAHGDAQTGVAAGLGVTPPVASCQNFDLRNPLDIVALGHKKAPGDSTRRFLKMERAKRLELSTSSLARKCSTN
jgi:integrase